MMTPTLVLALMTAIATSVPTPSPLATAASTPAPAASSLPSLAPASQATDTPTPPPVVLDVANLRHAVDAAATGFKGMAKKPQPGSDEALVTVYDIAPLSGAKACEIDVDRTPRSPATLTCHVGRSADLIRADDEFAAYANAFATVSGVAAVAHVAPSRFFIVRTDTFALHSGVRVVLTNTTRIDPHYRATDFTIEAPVSK